MNKAERSRTYATLDGLRGVAALIVVTRHIGAILPTDPFPESFLAVDLFFLLSGFVVAHAYEARLLAGSAQSGVSLPAFLRIRLIRLYPLYLLGLALGFAAAVWGGVVAGASPNAAFLLKASVIGLLLLPAVPPLPMGASTLDGPTWTLFPELLVNFIYAAGVRRFGRGALLATIGLGAAGLVASEAHYGTLDGGWSLNGFPLLGARLAFSFFLGVAMFRLRLPRRTGSLAAWACLAGLAVALMLHPPEAWRRAYELALVLGLFPALVAVAVQRDPRVGARLFGVLGLVSYAVYVLHAPLGALVGLGLAAIGQPVQGPLAAAVFIAAAAGLCALVDRVYDAPVRGWLAGRRKPPSAAAPLDPRPATP